jgi:serine/threonine protein kinase
VERLLGEGGMGRVYAARQQSLDRPVAIKRIHPHLLASPEAVSHFMREAWLASRLTHPNIVRIYDFGQLPEAEGSDLYLVMEKLVGTDLEQLLASEQAGSLDWGIDVLLQTLRALAEAHASGITHYDIKPENLVLIQTRSGDWVKIIDFGVSLMKGTVVPGSPAPLAGTPYYMSPEQVRGENAHISADLYAVGVILFQILTGRLLFDGRSVHQILFRQLTEPRPDPRAVAPDRNIAGPLARACMKAIAIRKEDRFQCAEDFYEALTEAQDALSLPPMLPSKRELSLRSSPYSVVSERTAVATLVKLDKQINTAIESESWDAARKLLEDAAGRARVLFDQDDEMELAAAAWASFADRLAQQLARAGQLGLAFSLLEEALARLGPDAEGTSRLRERLAEIQAAQECSGTGPDITVEWSEEDSPEFEDEPVSEWRISVRSKPNRASSVDSWIPLPKIAAN